MREGGFWIATGLALAPVSLGGMYIWWIQQ